MKKIILIGLFLLYGAPVWASCVSPCVQIASSTGTTTALDIFPGALTSGHSVLISAGFCADASCATDPSGFTVIVTDAAGANTYTKIADTTLTNQWRIVIFIASNVTNAVGAENITVSVSGTPNYLSTSGVVFSGVLASPLDAGITGTANNGSGSTSFSVATTGSATSTNVIVYSAVNVSFSPTAGSGYNLLSFVNNVSLADEFKEDMSGCATETATWTTSPASTWSGAVVVLKETGGSSCGGGSFAGASSLTLMGVGVQ